MAAVRRWPRLFVKDEGPSRLESSKAQRRCTVEQESKLANAAWKMEKAKAQLVPTLTDPKLDKPMQQPLPYNCMTILTTAIEEPN